MALTGRTALAALVGAAVLIAVPGLGAWLVVLGLLAVLVLVDLISAGSPKSLALQRSATQSIRLGRSAETTLTITNAGHRRVRGVVRDAWPPSAGAVTDRHALDLPPGERRRVTTALTPT